MLQQPSITTEHLVVTLSPESSACILDEWTWLIGMEKRPILATACGDVFVEDTLNGTIYFLNVSVPEFSQVAATKQAFEKLFVEPSFVDDHLHPDLVAMLRGENLVLKENQIYSFSKPLSLGGKITPKNIEITDVEVHFSLAGQIESQIFDIPVGSPISGIKIGRPPNTKRWWKFW